MSKRITTELVVKAVDQYSGMIRNMTGVTGRFANKVRSEMGRLQGLRGPLRLIDDFRRQQTVVRSSGEAMEAARERVRQLQHAIKTTHNPTAQMRREFERARAAAARLEEKHQQNRRALHGLQGQLRAAGVKTNDLAGEQRRLTDALGAANSAFSRQAERMQRLKVMQDRITAGRERMDKALARSANLSFVGSASMATGRRMISGVSAPIMQAVEFESAMSDVRKVVDFESPAAFRSMSDDILELSTRIPMAATGLAEIVAAGGQSGIAQGELARFAEMAAKIGVAFDISAGRSGDSMANIKTALGLNIEETGLLFDAMNHLSNNMASTAPKVLDFTTRVAADGKVKGFNATETLAFGSAMIAAGAQADVAATSFRNMGKALVRGAASTPKQRAAFRALGLDAAAVARNMQEDAVGTTLDVLKRINELPAHVRSSTISQIFGDEARALTPLIGNLDLLRESLGLVSDERKYAGSADAEYAERAKTTAHNMQLLRNQVTRLGISIGEVVLPPLNDLLSKSQVFIDKVVNWTKEHPKLTKWLVISSVALGGMAVAGGALMTAAAGLIGALAVLRFGLVGLGARAMFAGGGLANVAGRFGLLRRMPRLRLASLVTPLRWAGGLVPAIRWSSLAGRLSWSSLIRPLAWIGRGALRFIPVIGWAVLAGELAWHLLIKPLGWDKYLPSVDWSKFISAFSWSDGVPVIDWSIFVSSIAWGERIEGLDWSSVLKKLVWNTFLLPVKIADFVGRLMWKNVIEPLGWDKYIPSINWGSWFSFSWSDYLPAWSWDFITEFDMSGLIKWPNPPEWMRWFRKDTSASTVSDVAVQKRASGGPFGTAPLLVGERGPELYFPNRSGFIATNHQTRQLQQGAQRVRSAGMAALTGAAIVGSVATTAAAGTVSPSSKSMSTRVEIGSISIVAPSGVSDPEGLVELIEARLADRVDATIAASFSD